MTVSWDVATQHILERARVVVRREVSEVTAATLLADARMRDRLGDRMGLELTARLFREVLPPEHIRHYVREEHVEAVGVAAWTTDFRFARPWDHFVAKYRGRWWGATLRRIRVRYVEVPVPFVNNALVQCNHTVDLEVRGAWTYPAPTVPAPADQGYAVWSHGGIDVTGRVVPGESDPWM